MPFPGFVGTYLPNAADDFNRADGPLGNNWTVGIFNPLAIDSRAVEQTFAGENGMYWNVVGADDMGCAFTLSTFDSTDYAHYVHIEAPGAVYQYQLYLLSLGGQAELYGGGSQLQSGVSLGTLFAQGDRLGCRITREGSSNRIRMYRQPGASGNWMPEVYNFLATGAPAGPFYGGIGFYDSTIARADNFLAEPISALPSSTPYPPAGRGATW